MECLDLQRYPEPAPAASLPSNADTEHVVLVADRLVVSGRSAIVNLRSVAVNYTSGVPRYIYSQPEAVRNRASNGNIRGSISSSSRIGNYINRKR